MSTCRSCGDTIIWGVTVNGKRAPFNETPDPAGKFKIDETKNPPVFECATPTDPPGDRFTNHFATCPDRSNWRNA